MVDIAALAVRVDADVSAAESALGRFSGSMGSLLGAGVLAAGAAVAAGVAVGVKAAGDLEQSVANISTIKPDIDTSAVFASLNDLSTKVPQSSKQLGDALYNVFSSIDVSTEQAMGLVETFAKGAVGAQTDAETFGTSILGVLNAYGLAAENAGHVSDVFFNTVNKGVVTGQELATSLGPVTQAAKLAGVSLDELGGLIAGVTKEGGPAEQNINNLNNVLQKITTKEAAKGFAELGINVANADGSMRPVVDVLGDLKAATAGMTDEARVLAIQKIFPDQQARAGAAVLMSQLDFVKAAIEDNKTSAGSAASAFEKMSATFNSQVKILQNTLLSILTTIGAEVLPAITPLVKAFAESLPGAFATARAALAPVFTIIADGWRTVQQVFSNDWSPSDQIDPFVNALGVLATFIRDDVMPIVKAVADFIVQQFGVVVDWVGENLPLIQKTVQVVLGNISAMWDAHGAAITTIVQTLWTVVTTVVGNSIKMVGDLLKLGMQLITGDWSGAWATVQDIVSLQWSSITTVIGGALTIVGTLIDDRTGGMLTTVTTWMGNTATAIGTTWDTITADVGNTLTRLGSSILDTFVGWAATGGDLLKAVLSVGAGIVAAIRDGIAGALGGFWSWLQDSFVDKIPSFVRDLLNIHSPSGVFADIGRNIVDGLRVGMESKLPSIDDVVSRLVGTISTAGDVTDWLKAAISVAGVGESWLPGLQRLVSWESSGNPTARNPEAVNGQHATGLLQTLPSTFKAYALPGMGDITNPIHNAAAAIRYIKDTYGSVYEIPGIRDGDHGAFPGYEAGGWAGLHGPELAWLGEHGPEYVVPNTALRGGGVGLLERHEIAITIGGREAERIYVTGRDLAIRRGRE